MQCSAETSATVFRFAGGCGCFIFWFGCSATTRLYRGSRSCRTNKKKRRHRLKQLALCHDLSYGPQGRGYRSSVHYRCLPNELRVRFTPSILRASCRMADENGPTHVSDTEDDADWRSLRELFKNGRF